MAVIAELLRGKQISRLRLAVPGQYSPIDLLNHKPPLLPESLYSSATLFIEGRKDGGRVDLRLSGKADNTYAFLENISKETGPQSITLLPATTRRKEVSLRFRAI